MITADRVEYDAEMKAWAIEAMAKVRPTVFFGPRMMAGRRFNDDQYVLAVLESMTKQIDFERYPLFKLQEALGEAANADYWYEREKQYGSEADDDLEGEIDE